MIKFFTALIKRYFKCFIFLTLSLCVSSIYSCGKEDSSYCCELPELSAEFFNSGSLMSKELFDVRLKGGQKLVSQKGRPRAIVLLFGISGRSVKYTWSQIDEMIIKKLESEYDVKIHLVNNNIENASIDKTFINNDDRFIIPYDSIEEVRQVDVDAAIDVQCPLQFICQSHYTLLQQQKIYLNMTRQHYLEKLAGDFLEKNYRYYDVAIALVPDAYPLISLDMDEVTDVLNSSENIVYLSGQGESLSRSYEGDTNGFYIGRPRVLAKLLQRYDDIPLLQYLYVQKTQFSNMIDGKLMSIYNIDPVSEGVTYEYYLRLAREYYGIVKQRSSMNFCKMRANRCCRWQGTYGYSPYTTSEERRVLKDNANQLIFSEIGFNVRPVKHLEGSDRWGYRLYSAVRKLFGVPLPGC